MSYLELSVGLHCWQIWHSAAAGARTTWWIWVCVIKPIPIPHLCHWGHCDHGPIGQEWLGKETGNMTSYQVITELLLCWSPFLMSTYLHGTQVYSHPYHLERSIPILVSQTSFTPISQSCFLHVVGHLVYPLVTTRESVKNWTSCHFPFRTKCITVCTAWSSAHREDIPSPVLSGMLLNQVVLSCCSRKCL